MKQDLLAKRLKVIIIGVGVCAFLVCAVIVPLLGKDVIIQQLGDNLKGLVCYWAWMAFVWMTVIPCYIALGFSWKIAVNIGKDRSFSQENANLLKWISELALWDSVFWVAGNIIYLFLDINHPGVIILSLIIAFIGISISIAFAALSHLVMKAAQLQNQSDLTI